MRLLDRLSFIRSALLLVPLSWLWSPESAHAGDVQRAVTLNKAGIAQHRKSHYQEAIATFEEMLSAAADIPYGKGVALYYLGLCRLEIAQYEHADKLLQDAEKVFGGLNKSTERAVVIQTRARILAEQCDYSRSMELYKEAAKMLFAAKDTKSLPLLISDTGAVHGLLGYPDKALECLGTAGKLAEPQRDPGQFAAIANNEGMSLTQQQDYTKAQQRFDVAGSLFGGSFKGIAVVSNNVGYLHECRSEYTQALHFLSKALKISEMIKDPRNQAVALNNLGNVHLKTGENAKAREMYESSIKLSEKFGFKQFRAETVNNRGLVHIAYGEYARAMECFQQARNGCESLGVVPGQAWALHNSAFLLKDQGKIAEARQLAQEAVKLADSVKNRRIEATATLRLGNLEEYLGLYSDAMTHYTSALTRQIEIGDAYFQAHALADMAVALTRKGDAAQAAVLLNDAVKIKVTIGAPSVEQLCKFGLVLVEKHRYVATESEAEQRTKDRPRPASEDLDTAGRLIEQARKEIRHEHVHDRMLFTYVRAKLLLEQEPSQARAQFQELRKLAVSVGSGKYSFLGSVGLGLACERLKEWSAAAEAFKEAVAYVNAMEQTLDPSMRQQFLEGEQILGVKHSLPIEGLKRVTTQTP